MLHTEDDKAFNWRYTSDHYYIQIRHRKGWYGPNHDVQFQAWPAAYHIVVQADGSQVRKGTLHSTKYHQTRMNEQDGYKQSRDMTGCHQPTPWFAVGTLCHLTMLRANAGSWRRVVSQASFAACSLQISLRWRTLSEESAALHFHQKFPRRGNAWTQAVRKWLMRHQALHWTLHRPPLCAMKVLNESKSSGYFQQTPWSLKTGRHQKCQTAGHANSRCCSSIKEHRQTFERCQHK